MDVNCVDLTVKCRPIYIPRKFTVVMVTAVYVPPNANANLAMEKLQKTISSQQNSHPDAVHIIAGDFNHADLRSVFPNFEQYIKCLTRGKTHTG